MDQNTQEQPNTFDEALQDAIELETGIEDGGESQEQEGDESDDDDGEAAGDEAEQEGEEAGDEPEQEGEEAGDEGDDNKQLTYKQRKALRSKKRWNAHTKLAAEATQKYQQEKQKREELEQRLSGFLHGNQNVNPVQNGALGVPSQHAQQLQPVRTLEEAAQLPGAPTSIGKTYEQYQHELSIFGNQYNAQITTQQQAHPAAQQLDAETVNTVKNFNSKAVLAMAKDPEFQELYTTSKFMLNTLPIHTQKQLMESPKSIEMTRLLLKNPDLITELKTQQGVNATRSLLKIEGMFNKKQKLSNAPRNKQSKLKKQSSGSSKKGSAGMSNEEWSDYVLKRKRN